MPKGKKWTRNQKIQLFTAFVQFLALVTVIIGFRFAYLQFKTMKQSAHASSFFEFQDIWESERFVNARIVLEEIVMENKNVLETFQDKEAAKALIRLCDFYESLGWSVSCGIINFDTIRLIYGSSLLHFWDTFGYIIKHLRKRFKDEQIYEHFEEFAERYRKSMSTKNKEK